ncbi:FAD-binding protein [Chryseobacterium sp. WG23]|uniref:D-arabinono-1,4-lactone oxidase n=1 Tax=Chryseobacterium sp. WG23 TaxID=2926910 RepID=UPI00211E46F3|nr:D-arabinono-1,4-lactone oxidase [Chryseobacterium sp. WG23]MCQ9635731.1 FAD-binding protein [Chryseobacterium sp. WG23]
MIKEENYSWNNWAGNQSCIAENYFEPEIEEQIIEIVCFAEKNKKKIRVIGSGHSFSPIAISNEILVSLKNYRKLISVGKDSVTCQGGMYLHELYTILKANTLSFPNFGVINKQTVAGALATGTHGSGLKHRSLSAQIERLRMITASGDLLEINKETILKIGNKNLNILEAASLSLGSLGIVTEITLKCEPLFYLKSEESVIEFDEFLESMDDYAKRYEYFKAWWFPHTDKVYLFRAERVEKEQYSEKSKWENYTLEQKDRDLQIDTLTTPLFIKSNADPSLIPEINAYCLDYFFTPRTKIGNSFEILVHDETIPMVVSEYGLPILDGIHKKALKEFRDTLEHTEHKVHFPVDLRYTAAEESWLSPSYQKDTFYIGMCVREYREKKIHPSMQLFFDVMKKYNASPNWGKLSDLSKSELEERFPGINDFRELRNNIDPKGVFLNEFIKSIF